MVFMRNNTSVVPRSHTGGYPYPPPLGSSGYGGGMLDNINTNKNMESSEINNSGNYPSTIYGLNDEEPLELGKGNEGNCN